MEPNKTTANKCVPLPICFHEGGGGLGETDVRLPASLFYIERDPHSRTKIGGRDILAVHKNEAMVA